MKKISLYLSLMIFSGSLIGQINNGDFENWTKKKLYDYPTMWNSSNQEFRGITQNAIKSSDAQHLTSSIKLETTLVNGDTTFAFVLHGEPNDTGIGGGIPFTGTIDSLIFWVKYSIVAGDSATAIIITKNSGFATGTDVMKWTGLQSVWTRKALKVSSTLPVDSIIVGFVSGNAFEDYSYPGSWVLLDNVSVKLTSGTVHISIGKNSNSPLSGLNNCNLHKTQPIIKTDIIGRLFSFG